MNIICMKWGNKYLGEYINRLYVMVSRNMNSEFRFIWFTENSIGIVPERTTLSVEAAIVF